MPPTGPDLTGGARWARLPSDTQTHTPTTLTHTHTHGYEWNILKPSSVLAQISLWTTAHIQAHAYTHTHTRSYTIVHLLLRLLIFSSSFCPVLSPPLRVSVFNQSFGLWWDIDGVFSRRWSPFRHRVGSCCTTFAGRTTHACHKKKHISVLLHRLGNHLLLRRSPSRHFSMKVMFRLWLWLGLSTLCINSCHEFALGLDRGVLGAGRGEGNRRAGATALGYFPLSLFCAF